MKIRHILMALGAISALVLGACDNSPTAPGEQQVQVKPPHRYTRDDLRPEGDVVETADGYTVKGALHLRDEDGEETSFVNADLNVEFDENGKLTNVSGRVQIPPPSDQVSFDDPIQADVGFFRGSFLNENRDFPVLLEDDIDYFVFHISVALRMHVKDDEDAETELTLQLPVGGTILMITDFNDPMFYTFGAQDILGAMGSGNSLHGNLPFVPIRPAEKVFSFGGNRIRNGTFGVFGIIEVEGEVIDNVTAGIQPVNDSPIDSEIHAGFQAGMNGAMSFTLGIKNVVGVTMPLGEASAGVTAQVSTQDGLYGAAFINGLVDPDLDWWPGIIPIKPSGQLLASGLVESTGRFDVHVHGEFGIETPGMEEGVTGDFRFTPDALTLAGAVVKNDATYAIAGEVQTDATTVMVTPPQELLDRISAAVNNELDESIAEAEAAWNELQDATADYEFELSLRGLRSALPAAMNTASSTLSSNIASALSAHEGEPYYNSLRTFLHDKDDAYYSAFTALKNAANNATDNDATRAAIEAALRKVAGYKYFDHTYVYKVAGITIKTVRIRRRILSDTLVNQLTTAANNVKYIKESSDRMIKAQQIYDAIPDKEIFEAVREDIENGVVVIPVLESFGFVHHTSGEVELFVVVEGERRVMQETNVFDLTGAAAAIADALVKIMLEA